MAGYDPQRGRARPRIGADEPAPVDGLLGEAPEAPVADEPEPVDGLAGEAPEASVTDDGAAVDGPPAEAPDVETIEVGERVVEPAPPRSATPRVADAPGPAEALQEALAAEAAGGELVAVPPGGRTVEQRTAGTVAVPERRTFVPRPAALVVFLLALAAAVVLALRLRRRRS